jgi:hypothetical protein
MPWPLTCSRTNRHPGPPITPILYSGTDHQTSLRAAYYTVDCLTLFGSQGGGNPKVMTSLGYPLTVRWVLSNADDPPLDAGLAR